MPRALRPEYAGAIYHVMSRGDRREAIFLEGRKEEHLARRHKGDAGRVRIAWRLRQETIMTLAWIAQRLRMGAWTHVSNLLGGARGPRTEPGKKR